MNELSQATRDILVEYLAAHRQLETAIAQTENDPVPLPHGPKVGILFAASKRYAAAFQSLEELTKALADVPSLEQDEDEDEDSNFTSWERNDPDQNAAIERSNFDDEAKIQRDLEGNQD